MTTGAQKFPMRQFFAGKVGSRHIRGTSLHRAMKEAVCKSIVVKHVGCHILGLSFATHLLEGGYDIRTVHELLGHNDVRTMIYPCPQAVDRQACAVRWMVFETGEEDYYADPHRTPR